MITDPWLWVAVMIVSSLCSMFVGAGGKEWTRRAYRAWWTCAGIYAVATVMVIVSLAVGS